MPTPVAAPDDDHLQMVPLSGQDAGSYDDGKKPGSSTEFFAIPHANRAKSESSRPPPAAPPVAAPPPVMQQIGGPMPVGPQPVMGIQGPMAAGPMPGGMGGGAYGMAPPNPDEGRTQSYRVFGVVIALVLMVCAALVVTVLLVVVAVVNNNQPEPLPAIVNEAPVRPIASNTEPDTGGGGGPKPIKPAPVVRAPKPTGPKPAPKPKAEPEEDNGGGPAGTPGRLTITVPADVRVTYFECSCPSGFRQRAKFANSTAALDNVPAEDCTVTFKGGTISSKFTARAGRTWNCSKLGSSQLSCR